MISLWWMMQIALRHALIPQLIWLKAADTVSSGTASSRVSWNPWAGIHFYRQSTLEQTGYNASCKCGHFSSVWIRSHFALEQIMLGDGCAHVSLFPSHSVLCFVRSTALPCGSELTAVAHHHFDLLRVDSLASLGGTRNSLTCARHSCE